MNILDDLNASQRLAVEYNDGPSLVIAGAGSGKTRVLTYKIAYIIQEGLAPWNILALTFTNKAANEMKERIGRLIGADRARYIHMGTFHSVFSHILRQEAEHLGFTSQFTIYDEADSRSLIKTIVKEMNLDDKMYKPAAVHNRISMAKNHIVSAQEYVNNGDFFERDRQARIPAVGKIYVAYQQRCANSNAMDFDDLLMLTYKLFRENDDIRKKWAERFKYVLVDEYQDTNKVQQQIVEQLTRENQHICVVGDDAQSIYAFRGASIDNILNFNKVYPNSKLFKLEQNYRSTQRIVLAANSIIKHNQRQIDKNIFSENEEGEPLSLKMTYSDKEEAAVVCKEIKRIKREDDCQYSDFAILYRTNAQSRVFEEECLKGGIPYRIYGGLSFYQRKEIKDVIAYFRLIVNPNDEEAFKRIINYPARGIGNATVDKVAQAAQKYGVSYWEVLTNPMYNIDLTKAAMTKLAGFVNLINGFAADLYAKDAYTLGQEIIEKSGIHKDLFSSKEPEYITRQENLEEFMAALSDFVEEKREQGIEKDANLAVFLQDVALQTDKESNDGNDDKITMMTVHAAKGLEYPTVIIVGMEENIFPSSMASDSLRELEEERRLFYVAITRAEKHCILTCAKNRWRYGRLETYSASRFLNEIDKRFISIDSPGSGDSSYSQRTRTSSFDRSGFGSFGSFGSRMQNSRPVADQFRADPKPKITSPRQPEPQVDPYSSRFKEQLEQARLSGNLRHGAKAGGFPPASSRQQSQPQVPQGFRRVQQTIPSSSAPSVNSSSASNRLHEGSVIEHQRFGIGTVLKIEGTGDNTKATVEFRNTGTKQLLLKFAKFTIV